MSKDNGDRFQSHDEIEEDKKIELTNSCCCILKNSVMIKIEKIKVDFRCLKFICYLKGSLYVSILREFNFKVSIFIIQMYIVYIHAFPSCSWNWREFFLEDIYDSLSVEGCFSINNFL